MSCNSCYTRPEPRRRRRAAWLALLLVCQLGWAAGWRDELPQAQALGEGDLRWLGFHIYHATLWSEQRPFRADRPFALQLQYQRAISRQRLVETSLDEMRRLSRNAIATATLVRWEAALNGALVDVAQGDQLIGVYLPGRGLRFYDSQHQLAEIADLQLAQAFFGIWLDEGSRDAGLRRQLLGTQP